MKFMFLPLLSEFAAWLIVMTKMLRRLTTVVRSLVAALMRALMQLTLFICGCEQLSRGPHDYHYYSLGFCNKFYTPQTL